MSKIYNEIRKNIDTIIPFLKKGNRIDKFSSYTPIKQNWVCPATGTYSVVLYGLPTTYWSAINCAQNNNVGQRDPQVGDQVCFIAEPKGSHDAIFSGRRPSLVKNYKDIHIEKGQITEFSIGYGNGELKSYFGNFPSADGSTNSGGYTLSLSDPKIGWPFSGRTNIRQAAYSGYPEGMIDAPVDSGYGGYGGEYVVDSFPTSADPSGRIPITIFTVIQILKQPGKASNGFIEIRIPVTGSLTPLDPDSYV